jgi:YHS domain-containing protein
VTGAQARALALVLPALLASWFALVLPGEGTAQRMVPMRDKAHWRIKYPDSLVSINDRCAVKEGALSTAIRPVYVNGKPVGFCCTTCPPVFVQGPEPYLERMKAKFSDPVRPGQPAHVAARLRYHVNWEIFYFADRASLEEFRKHVTQYCGVLTDPVSGVRFRPTPASPMVRHAGHVYYFTSDATRVKFQAAPLDYAFRKGA